MKKLSQLGSDLQHFGDAFKQKLAEILPPIIGVEGQKHFEESFDNQGFTDKNLTKWKKRKFSGRKTRQDGGRTKAYADFVRKDMNRGILVGQQTDTKGIHLKDSIRNSHTDKAVTFETDKPYAQVHNEGGHAGRGKGFEMPQRQFMGASEELDDKIEAKLSSEMDKWFSNLKI